MCLCVSSGVWCGLEMTGSSSSTLQCICLSGRDQGSWLVETSVALSRTHRTRGRGWHLLVCCHLLIKINRYCIASLGGHIFLFLADSTSSCQSPGHHGKNEDGEQDHKRNKWVWPKMITLSYSNNMKWYTLEPCISLISGPEHGLGWRGWSPSPSGHQVPRASGSRAGL